MAANILVREFKLPMADYSAINISPDGRVMRFFKAHALLRKEGTIDELPYLARELNTEFPGLLDIAAWRGGASATLTPRRNGATVRRAAGRLMPKAVERNVIG